MSDSENDGGSFLPPTPTAFFPVFAYPPAGTVTPLVWPPTMGTGPYGPTAPAPPPPTILEELSQQIVQHSDDWRKTIRNSTLFEVISSMRDICTSISHGSFHHGIMLPQTSDADFVMVMHDGVSLADVKGRLEKLVSEREETITMTHDTVPLNRVKLEEKSSGVKFDLVFVNDNHATEQPCDIFYAMAERYEQNIPPFFPRMRGGDSSCLELNPALRMDVCLRSLKPMQELFLTDDEQFTSVPMHVKNCAYFFMRVLTPEMPTAVLRAGLQYGVGLVKERFKQKKWLAEQENRDCSSRIDDFGQFRLITFGLTKFLRDVILLGCQQGERIKGKNLISELFRNLKYSMVTLLTERQLHWIQANDGVVYTNETMVLQRLVLTGLLEENDGLEVPARYSVKSVQRINPSLKVTIMTHMLKQDGFFGDVMQTLLQGAVITKAFLVQNNITSAPVADQVELWYEKRLGGKHVSLTDLLNSMAQADNEGSFVADNK